MKSRILSFRGLVETWKRQLWVFALACLTYFIIYPVSGMLAIDRWMEYRELARIPGAYQKLLIRWLYGSQGGRGGGTLTMILLVAVCLGILCGVNGMSYLHSRRRMDFYHSLPERRETLFFSQVLVGSATYLIASTAGMLILMIVAVARGAFSLAGFGAGLASVLAGLVLFFMGYALAALAMLLTGRVLVGVLGTAVFFGYIPLLKLLKEGLCETFFTNYMSVSAELFGHEAWTFGTPFGWASNIGQGLNGGNGWMLLLLAALVTALMLALDIWVYRMRPSEAAGSSMAFGGAAAVIKVALTVTGALAIGLFFQDVGSNNGGVQDFWFAFGLIFGLLLCYAVIQMIYYLNIRKLFAGRSALLLSVLLAAAAALIVRCDLLGFNDYLPKQEDLAEIDIVTDGEFLNTNGSNFRGTPRMTLDSMGMESDEELYRFAARLLESSEIFAGRDIHVYNGPVRSVYVKYVTKGGSAAYRNYQVFAADIREESACLYDHPEYLRAMNGSLYTLDPEDVTSVMLSSLDEPVADEEGLFEERDDGRIELVEALRSDLKTLNSRTAAGETPVGILYLYYKIRPENTGLVNEELYEATGDSYSAVCEVPVYSSFAKTLAILNRKGYRMPAQIDSDSVKEIRIDDFRGGEAQEAAMAYPAAEDQYDANTEEDDVQIIRDRAQIEEILGSIVDRRCASYMFEYEEDVNVEVILEDGTNYNGVLMRKDKMPEFLK